MGTSRFTDEQIIGISESMRRGEAHRALPPAQHLADDLLQVVGQVRAGW
jgi:hypothetical protein